MCVCEVYEGFSKETTMKYIHNNVVLLLKKQTKKTTKNKYKTKSKNQQHFS